MVKKAGAKRKKAEKSKVQLKTKTGIQQTPLSKNKKKSFKLPKGRNELDTKINAKSLVLPSQLCNEDASGPSTSKNLPLKHYLIKLKHYSRSIRLDGLRGIKEILGHYPESATESLSSLLYKVSPLLSDPEGEVGRECGKIITLLVSLVEEESLAPFHPVLSAHLCVALSHIDQSIQRTGLRTLDEFIQSIPMFIQSSYKQILPCLLNQISMGKEGVRKLSNKVDCGKVTHLQWRSEVLERLQGLFQSLLLRKASRDDGTVDCGGDDGSIPMEWLDGESLRAVKSSSGGSFSLSNFSHSLLPLLFETWKEASLSSGKRKQGGDSEDESLLHVSNSQVFVIVVDILQLITSMLKQESENYDQFRRLMDTKISTHLLPGFPYRFASLSNKNKNSEDLSVFINLKFSSIYLDVASQYKLKVIEKILDYNLGICDSRGKDQDDIYHALLESLASIILLRNQFPTLVKRFDHLLQKSIEQCPKNPRLIQLLSELSSQESCRNSSAALRQWIQGLPKLLVESSSTNREAVLAVIQRLQKQNNSLLLEAFASQMNFVMDKLKRKSQRTDLNETLQLLSILSYRLKKIFPSLTDLVKSTNDEFTSTFHINLNASIAATVC